MNKNQILNGKGVFITATGTDVGKTFISALILKYLREQGEKAGYFKPALSGATVESERLIGGDAHYVCRISGLKEDPSELVSYLFETAVSPHLAAQIENGHLYKTTKTHTHQNKTPYIKEEIILQDYKTLQENHDFMVVEGCGGILCPLRTPTAPYIGADEELESTLMLADIIKQINLPIIIVAHAGLGTINATLLTVAYARQQRIEILGIILNYYDKNNFLHQDNKDQIVKLTGLPILCCVPENATALEFTDSTT